ncbi:MAG: MerR family transcriptional regulator [Alphaproteobacteria bacterium]|nr:MerR family transcriptional regulator [Alphaproteobacteria bacterium]
MVRPVNKTPLTGRVIEEKSSPPRPLASSPAPQQAAAPAKKAPGAFKTISEVADALDVQQHVLRFWETKFSQIRPLKRGGGRRYYRPEDLELLRRIHHLLYTEGYTIKGVQKLLKEKGRAGLLQEGAAAQAHNGNEQSGAQKVQASVRGSVAMNTAQRSLLQTVLVELKEIRGLIKAD